MSGISGSEQSAIVIPSAKTLMAHSRSSSRSYSFRLMVMWSCWQLPWLQCAAGPCKGGALWLGAWTHDMGMSVTLQINKLRTRPSNMRPPAQQYLLAWLQYWPPLLTLQLVQLVLLAEVGPSSFPLHNILELRNPLG